MADRTYLTGLFADRDSAEMAYQRALDRGYTQHDLDVVMSDHTQMRQFADDDDARSTYSGTRAGESAEIGAAVGPISTALAAIGASIAVPGLDLVIAGPTALAGAGGAAGGLAGALSGWNVPEERIKLYERGVAQGGILMGLRPRNEEDAIHLERLWRNADGVDVSR